MATLVAASAQAAGTVSTPVTVPADILGASFQLNITSVAAGAGDTLDVYVQHSPDGTNWDDFVHFTQALGNGGVKRFIAGWSGLYTPESEMHLATDGTLAAGVTQGPVAKPWRVKVVIVGGTALFSFALTASYMRERP